MDVIKKKTNLQFTMGIDKKNIFFPSEELRKDLMRIMACWTGS